MSVLVGSNSLYVLGDCINSVENPTVYICCAFPVVRSKLQSLATIKFRHFELHFRNNLHRPMCPKTRLSGIDEMLRRVMNVKLLSA
jgi:hypothetical protein